MKNCIYFTLAILLTVGCNLTTKSNNPNGSGQVQGDIIEVIYKVKTEDKEDLEIFEDGFIPWISIKEPNLEQLVGRDEIVLKASEAYLIIDYPLNKPVDVLLKPTNGIGFSRGELIQKISTEYKRIYKEEEQSAKVKTVPMENRKGLINRNETDGKYGIWGHDIEDLDLSVIIIRKYKDDIPKLELYIES